MLQSALTPAQPNLGPGCAACSLMHGVIGLDGHVDEAMVAGLWSAALTSAGSVESITA